jgi:site-specific DNA recombinase
MKHYYGYIRVSTARQGEGVSLQQQKAAIEQYSQRHNLQISQWFEELETAAKAGRPLFSQMIKQLKKGSARGVIIHKIDRSARNLRDWADLGELIDAGIDVHFANESLDLNSRGGRLSADIQAVVAADYIRNLREETKKGFYGRLKQGLYPMPAPVGYLDRGQGQPKALDPKTAPLVRKAFELYATGGYNLTGLGQELARLGLRMRSGSPYLPNRLSKVLNNPFYMGLIRIKRSGETYTGIHQPLISRHLFERVRRTLNGKSNARTIKHDFIYRRRLSCKTCGYSLVGETKKGYIYYRCQSSDCPTTCVREEVIELAVLDRFERLRFDKDEHGFFRPKLATMHVNKAEEQGKIVAALSLQLAQMDARLNRLTDAYIDRLIEKDLFEQRKNALLIERTDLGQQLAKWKTGTRNPADVLLNFLERADGAYFAYKLGLPEEKRDLLESVTSNRLVSGKLPEIMLKPAFQEVADRFNCSDGGPGRNIARTWEHLFKRLLKLLPSTGPAESPALI